MEEDFHDILDEEEVNIPRTVIQFARGLVIPIADKLYKYKDNNFEYFSQQIKKKLPDNFELFINLSMTDFIEAIVNKLFATIGDNKTITPWTIEKAKQQAQLTNLLGEVRKELSIMVVTDEAQQYQHFMSEELAYGILITLDESSNITLYTEESFNLTNENPIPLALEYLDNNFMINNNQRIFTAMINNQLRTFDTPTVIQGIITGARWTNQDPHNFIKNIFQGSILVTF